jgi:hypothetical protein
VAEETRQLDAVYDRISFGFVDTLRREIAHKLALPLSIFKLDRFSIHGCGPIGLHDDFLSLSELLLRHRRGAFGEPWISR